MPKYSQNINSSSFTLTAGGGVKSFICTLKTFTIYTRALIGVVSRLHKVLTFLKIDS